MHPVLGRFGEICNLDKASVEFLRPAFCDDAMLTAVGFLAVAERRLVSARCCSVSSQLLWSGLHVGLGPCL